jgi:hypothetical protein
MKHSLKALVLGSLFTSSVALAATSGSITLGGTIASTLELSSVSTAGSALLDLTPGEHVAKVADIEMSTNNVQGLTLTASSGNLSHVGGADIAFQVTSVTDGATAPVAGDFAIASGGDYTVGTAVAGTDNNDMYILYTPSGTQDPGAYAGTITLTVTDN